ncbi:MAG: right-handed parallel beta-helix repeat-containing protein, partial [Myxococcota bacterium]|nr:right-handed parallel beta-helix repeat-containing protein [Myxococcota bacterium]
MTPHPLWMTLLLSCDPGTTEEDPPCQEGELLDGDSCVPEACGTGTWGEVQTDADTVYVDGSAQADGDGSEARPFTTIEDGLDAMGTSGGTVAVAAGTYVENLYLDSSNKGVHIAGRCRELVTLDASDGPADNFNGAGAYFYGDTLTSTWSLSGLVVHGGQYTGMFVDGGKVVLSRVTILEGQGAGIYAADAQVEAGDLEVLDTLEHPQIPWSGYGITLQLGSTLQAIDSAIRGSVGVGLDSYESSILLQGFEVRDTLPYEDGSFGRGISLQDDTHMVATDTTLSGHREYGLYAADSTVELDGFEIVDPHPPKKVSSPESIQGLTQVRVLDPGAVIAQEPPSALWAHGSTTLEARALLVEGAYGYGIKITEATVVLTDSVVRGTRTSHLDTYGYGIVAYLGARLEATNLLVEDNLQAGIGVIDAAAELEDSQVLDTRTNEAGNTWGGLVANRAELSALGCTFQGNRGQGVLLDTTTASLENCEISDTELDGINFGRGLQVLYTDVELADCNVQGNRGAGVLAHDSTMRLQDCAVTDTLRDVELSLAAGLLSQVGSVIEGTNLDIQGTQGPALWSNDGGFLSCTDCIAKDNQFAAAVSTGGGALQLRDTVLESTAAEPNNGGGFGVYVYDSLAATEYGNAAISIQDCTIRDNDLGSIYLRGPGRFEISGNDLEGTDTGKAVNNGSIWNHGDGVFAQAGATGVVSEWDEETQTGLLLTNNSFTSHGGAAVFLDGAGATLSENQYQDNAYDLVQQLCANQDTPVGHED